MRPFLLPLGLALLSAAATGAPRAEWRTTRLIGSPDPAPEMVAVRAYPEVPLKRPVAVEREPGSNRLFVLENLAWDVYKSTLKAFADDPAAREAQTLLEIPGEGEVAYSLCFHPRYEENGYIYIGSNGKGPADTHHSRIVRYTVARQAPQGIDPATAVTIIEWPSNGHNGAAACFGNDGMLYVTSGDGTPNSDSNLAGQDTASLLSKVLRLDVDGAPAGQPYRVPPDNPFVGNDTVRPETWAYGLRNPWRITNDPESGQIWVGQNGQDLREYAHLLERGANYGWSEYEGSRPFQPGRLRGPAPFTPPTLEHDHAQARSLTGGIVYRGKKFPQLQGAYIYGDYGTGRVWAARHDGTRLLWNRELADTSLAIGGFGTNAAGDILIADHLGDVLARLEPTPPPAPDRPPFPERLSKTGLFASVAAQQSAAGVYPYQINAPSWHDGAVAEYWLALPGATAAEMPNADDPAWVWKSWTPPNGTAVVQTLSRPAEGDAPARRIETRVLLKQDADWSAYSYVWNEAQSEAILAPAKGARLTLGDREWVVPARSECVLCHARGANYVLSLTAAQLNREVSVDGAPINQLSHWAGLGLIREERQKPDAASPFRQSPAELRRLVDPHDVAAPLDERVRAYFAANCSHCHRHEGGGNSRMDLSPWLAGEAGHLVGAAPQHGDYGMPDARLIAPGEPGRSVLPVRVSSRGPGQMPPVGSTRFDPQGLGLIFEWLVGLKPAEGKDP
jgi:glucose/arabinose dehydrogenase